MKRRVPPPTQQAIIEIAPALYATLDGQWLAEPAPGVGIIRGFDMPAPDPEIKQYLLSSTNNPLQTKISDHLGLWGKTKDLYDQAWDIGSAAVDAYTGVTWFVSLLKQFELISPGPDPVGEALKKIIELLEELNLKVDALFKFEIANLKSDFDSAVTDVEGAAKSFLAQQKGEDRKDLEEKLEKLHNFMNKVTNPAFFPVLLVEKFDVFQQFKGADWLDSLYGFPWNLEFMPAYEDPGVARLGLDWPPYRWNYLGWAFYIARATSILILGHKLVNPATGTAGKYRTLLNKFATGLRALAARIMATIQMTREIEFPRDAYTHPNWGFFPKPEFSFDILEVGWPVGAVDTITGASVFTLNWKPAENGFPLLKGLKGQTFPSNDPDKLPWWIKTSYFAARKKADAARRVAWFQIVLSHPVIIPLFRIAHLIEEMAKFPEQSETVEFDSPKWTGKRTLTGTSKEAVGGVFCEKREFEKTEYVVEQRVSLNTTVQLDLFKTSTHEIVYRVLLESYPHWATSPDRMSRTDMKELTGGTGVVQLNVPSFELDIEEPPKILDVFKLSEPLSGQIPGNEKELAYYWHVPAADSQQPTSILPGVVSVDQPIKQRHGMITAGPMTKMSVAYELVKKDGLVSFTIENTPNMNALLWLVIEEDLGDAGMPPPVMRTGVRLAMIGKERYWSPGYTAHRNHCNSEISKALIGTFAVAKKRGIPVPQPDILQDTSFQDYALRLQKLVKHRK